MEAIISTQLLGDIRTLIENSRSSNFALVQALVDRLSISEADIIHGRMIDLGYRSPLPYENEISSFLASGRWMERVF